MRPNQVRLEATCYCVDVNNGNNNNNNNNSNHTETTAMWAIMYKGKSDVQWKVADDGYDDEIMILT